MGGGIGEGGGLEITQVLVPTCKVLHTAPLDEEARCCLVATEKRFLIFGFFKNNSLLK
jgi:hypothetical protein